MRLAPRRKPHLRKRSSRSPRNGSRVWKTEGSRLGVRSRNSSPRFPTQNRDFASAIAPLSGHTADFTRGGVLSALHDCVTDKPPYPKDGGTRSHGARSE